MTHPGAASRVPFIRGAARFGVVLASMAECASTAPVIPQLPAYAVFFMPSSADLDDGAMSVIAEASRAAQVAAGRRVMIELN